jgi:hypothetical protein
MATTAQETQFEKHWKVKDLANAWALSYSTVLHMFMDEPGVLKTGERRGRRRTRICLSIPETVARRVYARRTR